jgi:hypothetical protein
MTRTDLMRKINDMMTAAGATLTEDQDAVLAAALAVLLPIYVEGQKQ